MKALLDTHVFLWWITGDPRLSARAREVIGNGENEIFLSAASGWEMAIKAKLGKLHLPGDPVSFVAEQMAANGFDGLPVQMSHALSVYTLPPYHHDPFDRLLVVQAKLENLRLLTADPQITRYPVEIIW